MSRRRLLGGNRGGAIPQDFTSEWKLEETSGTTFFDSKGVNNGTQSGISAITTDAKVGKGFYWTDSYGAGIVPYSSDLILNNGTNNLPFSFCHWFKPTTSVSLRFFIYMWFGSTRTFEFVLTQNLLTAALYNSDATAFTSASSLNTSAVGVWCHLAVTFDPNNATEPLKIYVNGVKGTMTNTGTLKSIRVQNHDLRIGGLERAGVMDEVKFYKRTLATDEILGIYNAEL